MPSPDRHLAAILSADVVGYSRLMAEDEDATIRAVTARREEVELHVRQHQGRLNDFTGDNFLAEFGSAVAALGCAVEIQRLVAALNADLAPERKMEFRIGLHLGEVRVQDDRLFGTGVNVAARLESLAEPGGICISGEVHGQVESRLDLGYEDLGEQSVKNIPKPVRVYRVRMDAKRVEAPKRAGRGWTRLRIAAAFMASLILFVAAALWLGWPVPLGLVPDVAGLGGPPVNPPLSEKPSIAVLPFCNLSGDPEQAYFADGVTDDLTAMLSRSPDLLVISRSSSSRYECQPPDLKQVGRELGVRYAVEGSVRRAQDRVRITAQLIDATTDVHVWSESYERDLSPANVFDIQSDIASEIANTLLDEVRDWEAQRLVANPTAWDLYMRGRYLLEKSSDAEGVLEGHRLLEHAIELDPGLAPAHAMLALNYLWQFALSPKHDAELLDRAEAYARRSVALDPQSYFGHIGLGAVLNAQGKPTEAIQEARRAIELSPDSAVARIGLGMYQMRLGRLGEAKRLFDSVLQTDPRYPSPIFWGNLGTLHYLEGEIERAVELWERARTMTSLVGVNRIMLTRYYELAGRHEDAQAIVQEILSAQPEITAEIGVEFLARQWNEEWIPEDLETQLRSAGLR